MRSTLTLAVAAQILGGAVALTAFAAPAPAAAQTLPYEENAQVSCTDDRYKELQSHESPDTRTACFADVGERSVKISATAIPDPDKAPSDAFSILALYGHKRVDSSGSVSTIGGSGHVNIDRCTQDSVILCDGSTTSWETRAGGKSNEKRAVTAAHDSEPGIYRACGAPEHKGQKWLCTQSFRVNVGVMTDRAEQMRAPEPQSDK